MVEAESSSCHFHGKVQLALAEACFVGAVLWSFSIGKQQQVINLAGKRTVGSVCINRSCMRLLVGLENHPFAFPCVQLANVFPTSRFTVVFKLWNVTDGGLSLASCFILGCVLARSIKVNLVIVNFISMLFCRVLYLVRNS